MTTLYVYCDASFKDKNGVCSFVDTHTKTFYVSNTYHVVSSINAELYAIHFSLMESIKIARKYNYENIVVYSDLLMAENINKGGSSRYPLMQYLSQIICMFSDEINIQIKFHGKEGLMRMVDTLAYRKIRSKNLVAEKKEVFGNYYSYPVLDYNVQMMNNLKAS